MADDPAAALLAWRTVDRVHGVHDDEGMDALLRLRTVADRIAEDAPTLAPNSGRSMRDVMSDRAKALLSGIHSSGIEATWSTPDYLAERGIQAAGGAR